jgi:hypothetical protein
MLSATNATREWLQVVRKYGMEHRDLSEQDCIRDVTLKEGHGEKAVYVPQYKMNSFPSEIQYVKPVTPHNERTILLTKL